MIITPKQAYDNAINSMRHDIDDSVARDLVLKQIEIISLLGHLSLTVDVQEHQALSVTTLLKDFGFEAMYASDGEIRIRWSNAK